ncbi:MAG: hypothetical protein J3R72DRAFT_528027 [Linnemannia gamsii]|nr:MAG: hypothetical protein J3R72DRAFT_528027 [Linnemannia gamsii]
MPQHQSQAEWGLEALLPAARAAVHVQVSAQPEPSALQREFQTVAQAARSPSLQVPHPQPTQTQTSELVLPTSKLPPTQSHHRPAPGTGDPTNKKRKDSEDENGIPQTLEEAEFGSKYQDTLQRYRDGQVQQNLQSSRIRSADCAIRDSYSLTKFNDMVSSLWEKKSQEIRDPDLNYRELFCMASRHNMLLLDEDLRNLNLHEDVHRCSFSAFAFYMFQLWQFSKDEWDLFKILPSPLDPTTSISPRATYNAVKKLYDRFHVNSSKKTHGGWHSGTVESNYLEIPNEVIKEGGRWMADRGKMETYYSSNLPSARALGMAGFQDKPYYLSRNGVDPSVKLQQMVFPWIEEVYGKDNDEWKKECEAEMAEVDTNIVPPISAGAPSTLTKALAESGENSKAAMMITYQDRDIAKAGFLRLLVRCRRIILQDAAYRLHYKQKSLISNLEFFQSSLFTTFQQGLGDIVDKQTPNPFNHSARGSQSTYNTHGTIINSNTSYGNISNCYTNNTLLLHSSGFEG